MDWSKTLKCLFETGVYSDVLLYVHGGVNSKMIMAHRTILQVGSEVLNSTIKKNVTNIIDIHADPTIFHGFLEILYCEKTEFQSLSHALEILQLGQKYKSKHVKSICLSYIKAQLELKFICDILQLSYQHDLKELQDACIEHITENMDEFFKIVNLEDIKIETIQLILDQQNISINEYQLFKHIKSWIHTRVNIDGESVLGEIKANIIPKFCFLDMSTNQFVEGPYYSGLLTEEQSLFLMSQLISKKCVMPTPAGITTATRNNSIADKSAVQQFIFDNLIISVKKSQRMMFQVDKSIDILSIMVFTRSDGSGQYKGTIKASIGLEGSDVKLYGTCCETMNYDSVHILDFDCAVKIQEGLKYELELMLECGKYKFWNVENFSGTKGQVKFSFFKASKTSTCYIPLSSIRYTV
ncbi:uncharacterized protein LOC106665415 isoform X2 [Cimex lectularius]|uniref:BTB domain-containing protein n=1 Tax=Cimex lectularius TaxID=79782 RepID=A0A8I6RLC9_CIMLE|nr:uncharacterized protein LOC106665415 isoform X2 [Cimex lectularius]